MWPIELPVPYLLEGGSVIWSLRPTPEKYSSSLLKSLCRSFTLTVVLLNAPMIGVAFSFSFSFLLIKLD